MRVPYIAANWKMHSVKNQTALPEQEYAEKIMDKIAELGHIAVEVSVFCPYTHLMLMEQMAEDQFNVGAQDMHPVDRGAYTGDISAELLQDIGINHVLLGHSERRHYHNETDAVVAKKVNQSIQNGLYCVVCIGESDTQNQAGKTHKVLQKQIKNAIAPHTPADRIVIAYEPIWAIGTGRVPSVKDITTTHTNLRTFIAKTYGTEFADSVRIIYGGSVNGTNACEILHLPNVDGVLVGGASLHSDDFCKIIGGVL